MLQPFDLCMAAVLAVVVTTISKIHSPRWKSFIYSCPIPFTLAFLVADKPLNCAHAIGGLCIHPFLWSVWWMHKKANIPILVADAVAAVVYVVCVGFIARNLHYHSYGFYYSVIGAGSLFAMATLWIPAVEEEGAVSPMTIHSKFILVLILATSLYALKSFLLAAMTTFPYLGVFTVIECRHSLHTLARRFGLLSLAFMSLLATLRITQEYLALTPALFVAWIPCLFMLALIQFGGRRARAAKTS